MMGRVKLERVSFPSYKVDRQTLESLKQTALELGFRYGDGAAMGKLLDRIALVDRELLKVIINQT